MAYLQFEMPAFTFTEDTGLPAIDGTRPVTADCTLASVPGVKPGQVEWRVARIWYTDADWCSVTFAWPVPVWQAMQALWERHSGN